MKWLKLFAILMMMPLSSLANDKTITICSYEWPPHHGTGLPDEGYTAEIIKGVFEPQGYQIKKVFLPWKRAQEYAQEGKRCDAITELYFNEERLNYYWYGAPYSVHEVYLVGLKSSPIADYTVLHDLTDYKIGHNRAGSLSKEFDAADFLQKIETNGYANGINMLLNERIDLFVSARSVALYEANKFKARDAIRMVGKPLARQHVYMAFSKTNPENLLRLQDYNAGLFDLIKSGGYDEIIKKHGFE